MKAEMLQSKQKQRTVSHQPVDKTSLNMTVGTTETITATVKVKDQTVEWNSSDEKRVLIMANITAKSR